MPDQQEVDVALAWADRSLNDRLNVFQRNRVDVAIANDNTMDTLASAVRSLREQVASYQRDCALFCGDNERLIKATGDAENVPQALLAIAHLREQVAALTQTVDEKDAMLRQLARDGRIWIDQQDLASANVRVRHLPELESEIVTLRARLADLDRTRASMLAAAFLEGYLKADWPECDRADAEGAWGDSEAKARVEGR